MGQREYKVELWTPDVRRTISYSIFSRQTIVKNVSDRLEGP